MKRDEKMAKQYYSHNDKGITYFGRCLAEASQTYCNWTCSGFQFECVGKKIEAEWIVHLIEENGESLYPWIAVWIKGEDKPYRVMQLKGGTAWYTLYESDVEQHVQIKVVKRTEAQHSKTALKNIAVEGTGSIKAVPLKGNYRIEFVGDSITCGYGNEGNSSEEGFKTSQQNGLLTYAAQVATHYEADFHCVSVSGMGLYSSYTGEDKRNDGLLMGDIYDYSDYFVESQKVRRPMSVWDPSRFKADLIVVNLGTNDRSYLQYDYEGRKHLFIKAYVDFLKQLRVKNGFNPKILCVIGAMAPAIDELMVEAVEVYQKETNDEGIHTMVFDDQREADGIGGNGHPSVKTHTRMAEKMITCIDAWLEWT